MAHIGHMICYFVFGFFFYFFQVIEFKKKNERESHAYSNNFVVMLCLLIHWIDVTTIFQASSQGCEYLRKVREDR